MSKEASAEIVDDTEVSAEELLLNAQAEDFEEQKDNEEPELSEEEVAIREEASKMGWVDKDDYTGDSKRWVNAGEFIRRQELFDKIHTETAARKKLEKQLAEVTKYVKSLTAREYAQELARLRAQRDSAMDNDDREAADKANEDIAKLQVAKQVEEEDSDDDDSLTEVQQHAIEVADAWKQENSWFQEDPELTELADGFAMLFSNNPANKEKSVEDLFAFVDKKMKKHISAWEKSQGSDDSDEEEPEKETRMSKVTGSPKAGRRTQAQKSSKYGRSDLDATQLSTLVGWILPNKIMTEEEYIQSLVADGSIQKR